MNQLDEVIDRTNTYSIKWDGICRNYHNPHLIPLSIADMDWRSPTEVVEAVVQQAKVGIYGYPMPCECYSSIVSTWLKQQNNWEVKEQDIAYAVRVVDILSLAVCSLTNKGDAVMVHTPLYGYFKTSVVNAQRRLIANELVRGAKGYVIDFELLETQIADNRVKMFILCNPHNPTGRVWTVEELNRLLDICIEHQVMVVSDDIHSDLTLPGYSYTPLAKLAKKRGFDKVLTTKSASKTFNLAGLQLGYYISENPEIMKALADEKTYRTYPDLPNNFSLAAMKAAYQHGLPWLENVRQYIQQNYYCLNQFVEEKFPQVNLAPLQGTYLAWLDVSYLSVDEATLKETLDQSGIGVETTSDFGLDKGLYLRLNIACPRATLNKALEGLEKALSALALHNKG